jgi:hypothetical protein
VGRETTSGDTCDEAKKEYESVDNEKQGESEHRDGDEGLSVIQNLGGKQYIKSIRSRIHEKYM